MAERGRFDHWPELFKDVFGNVAAAVEYDWPGPSFFVLSRPPKSWQETSLPAQSQTPDEPPP
jgi:hypothetical protein